MGLRSTVASFVTAPVRELADTALRDLVHEIIAARSPVARAELEALRGELDGLVDEIRSRTQDLEGLRQALEAWHADMDDDLDEFLEPPDHEEVKALEATQATLSRTLETGSAAVDVAMAQLEVLSTRLKEVGSETHKAAQLASSALATAEAAADGVSDLETRMADDQ